MSSVELTLTGYDLYAIAFYNITYAAGSGYDLNKWDFSIDGGSNYLSSGIYQAETRAASWSNSNGSTGRSNVAYVEIGEIYGSGQNHDGIIYFLNLTHLLRNLQVIGFATIFFGILLYFADIKNTGSDKLNQISFKKVFIIGCSQILAIIPGTSRAGIIYTTSRFYKISRVEAAKFSILLSIPTILLSSFAPIAEMIAIDNHVVTQNALLAILIAFITAIISINLLLKWVSSHSMLPFVIYRIILGSIILILAI